MEYIISRGSGFKLPMDQSEIENCNWYNMWERKNFPYNELLKGDILFWYDTISKKLVWKTEIVEVQRFPYFSKQQIINQYQYPITIGEKYFDKGPNIGYFVGYKVRVEKKIEIPKPIGYKLPQIGWIKVNNKIAELWFNRKESEDTIVLDNLVDVNTKSLYDKLLEINEEMKFVSPKKISETILTTIRNDTKIIKLLKAYADFKCQFTDCGHRIIKKKGGFYIEVAHIEPVKKDGKSILGNLLVLCPNHHKEFDHGNLKVKEQTVTRITGELNDIPFDIEITN